MVQEEEKGLGHFALGFYALLFIPSILIMAYLDDNLLHMTKTHLDGFIIITFCLDGLLTFLFGKFLNRKGPIHMLYSLRLEYWGLIFTVFISVEIFFKLIF